MTFPSPCSPLADESTFAENRACSSHMHTCFPSRTFASLAFTVVPVGLANGCLGQSLGIGLLDFVAQGGPDQLVYFDEARGESDLGYVARTRQGDGQLADQAPDRSRGPDHHACRQRRGIPGRRSRSAMPCAMAAALRSGTGNPRAY